ncbi:short-chain dehydrogenase/reductase SDR [Spiroplasma sabaudiense Ar-1343]|uniref:Short-chain dehydrogenase/reductase SDR n=1 Tax=Spiroplasma sabaudiense Ar-1343 TaxID=1276257 RepID=W6AAP0_9MOLU|nr:SDR family NAD(P)-dependent oxidoreductase [Spiroplasma sabaudiense]AHI54081.1 short-chain dehydrogenase/reductase SDR [Spiroplasma sabaudiense Ar-1343]
MKKNKVEKDTWAIVTGASKGIGYAFCVYLLERGWNIVAVARNTDSINDLAKNFPNQVVLKLNLDLSDLDSCDKIAEETKNLKVSLLINNAGYGVLGNFRESSLEREMNMIDLNIKSLHKLTKIFVNRFQENNFGRIINISSVAAFLPGPGFASYYASKSYVLNLGIAVNHELKSQNSKVRLVTVCPGPINTGFWDRSRDNKSVSGQAKEEQSKALRNFARKSLNKSLKANNKDYFIIGINNIFLNKLLKFVPKKWAMKVVYRYNRKKNK